MSLPVIRAAFESRLSAWAATKGLPVAWQNAAFTPPATTYLRAFVLPAGTDCTTLERKDRRFRGVLQVNVVCAVDAGPGAAESLAAELDALFPPAVPMVRAGLSIWALTPMSAAPAIQSGDRFTVPVSCTYAADTYTT